MKEGRIKDSCIVIAGQSPNGSAYNENGVGIEFHQGKKAFGDAYLQPSGVWTTEVTKLAEPLDILMSVRAPVGPTNITDRQICIGRGLAAIRCKEGVLHKYVLYALKNIESKIVGNDGAVFNSINKSQIEDLPLPIIPLTEQERIVALLDDQFAKIDALKANADQQLKAAKDLFQSALKEMLTPKEGWEMKKVGDLFNSYSGGTPLKSHQEYYTNAHIPWLNSGEVCRKYITETDNYISEEGLKNSSAKYFPIDTVLVAMYGATAAQAGILKFEATSNQAICGLLPNDKMVPEFVYYWFVYNKEIFASMAQGGAQPNLSQIKIKAMPIPYIEKAMQNTICEKLTNIEEIVARLQANYDQTITLCNDLKQSLLKSIFE